MSDKSGPTSDPRLLYSSVGAALLPLEARAGPPRDQEETVRALLSVANRDGIVELARELLAPDVQAYATDRTRAGPAADGVEVESMAALTQHDPIAGGQVRAFHPAVYGGILARRHKPDELTELAEQGIELIDIVVVNVQPFAPQVGVRPVALDEAIEMIDVGGTALLAAAARNFAGVAAVSSPAHYRQLVDELREMGSVSAEFRQRLAADALADV